MTVEERWHQWQNGGLHYARLLDFSPPPVVRDKTADGLKARMEEFERVYAETRSFKRAIRAAEGLET